MLAAIDRVPPNLDAKLVLMGTALAAEDVTALNSAPPSRVVVLGQVGRQRVWEELQRSRVGLVVLHPTPSYREEPTNTKMYEYMLAGVPIVASDFPKWRTFVESIGCGLVADPMDADAIAHAIGWLLENPEAAAEMGIRGRTAVLERLNWYSEGELLVHMYQELIEAN
jgi:glycosyltransferase involved in cell wall biosynthesis